MGFVGRGWLLMILRRDQLKVRDTLLMRCTYRFTRGRDANTDVMSPVILAFFTNVSVVSLLREVSTVEGRVVIAVDSK